MISRDKLSWAYSTTMTRMHEAIKHYWHYCSCIRIIHSIITVWQHYYIHTTLPSPTYLPTYLSTYLPMTTVRPSDFSWKDRELMDSFLDCWMIRGSWLTSPPVLFPGRVKSWNSNRTDCSSNTTTELIKWWWWWWWWWGKGGWWWWWWCWWWWWYSWMMIRRSSY